MNSSTISITERGPIGRELEAAIDALVERYGSGAHEEDAVRARELYVERTGKVFDDDAIFEARVNAFLEWYVLEYPLAGHGVPPVVLALADASDTGGGEDLRAAWRAWATSHRSLFLVEAFDDKGVTLLDLVGGARFEVDERRRLPGVTVGDVVEARLCGWRGRVRFGRTFCFHPSGTRELIAGHVKRILAEGGTRADVVDHVASLRVRVERYRHLPPGKLYEPAASVPRPR